MFGISFIEFLTILTLGILLIGPKECADLARMILKFSAKIKDFLSKAKDEFHKLSDEVGLQEIKREVELEIAQEKAAFDDGMVTIVDIYGKEHRVNNLAKMHPEKSEEELKKEIDHLNKENLKKV